MKKLTILAALLGIFAMVAVAGAQEVGVSFDEDGLVPQIDGRGQFPAPPSAFSVFVVAFNLPEVNGFEFLLTESTGGAFLNEKVLYGPAPSDFGPTALEVRAGTGACVTNAAEMGPSPDSWTLVEFKFWFFAAPTADLLICVEASPQSGAPTPQFSLCDAVATTVPMLPGNNDLNGITPGGCAVAVLEWEATGCSDVPSDPNYDPGCDGAGNSPTNGNRDVVDTEETSFGAMKARF